MAIVEVEGLDAVKQEKVIEKNIIHSLVGHRTNRSKTDYYVTPSYATKLLLEREMFEDIEGNNMKLLEYVKSKEFKGNGITRGYMLSREKDECKN